MKKILLIAVLGTAALALSAQEKGDFSVGGVIGVSGGSNSSKISTTVANETSSTNSSSPAATSFTLSPMFNIFVIDNLQLSAGLSYQMGREFIRKDSNDKNLYNFTHIALGVIGAHYFVPVIKERLYYTPGIEFGFGGGSNVAQNSSSNKTTTKIPFVFAFNANLGTFEFKATEHIGISLNVLDLSVSTATVRNENTQLNIITKSTSTSFVAGLNYGISAGVKYYF